MSLENGAFVPTDWSKILFSPVLWVRFPHMLLAAYITGAFCVAATGAWYLLRGKFPAEAHIMLRMGLFLAAVLVPVQLFFGHLNGEYVHDYQPAKLAAIEARWHDEQPAREVLIAWPDRATERNLYAITLPRLGSLIAQIASTPKEVGLDRFSARRTGRPCSSRSLRSASWSDAGWSCWLLAWIGSYLSLQGAPGAEPAAAVADVPELPAAVHRHPDRLVHGRSRTSALDGLWRVAHCGLR